MGADTVSVLLKYLREFDVSSIIMSDNVDDDDNDEDVPMSDNVDDNSDIPMTCCLSLMLVTIGISFIIFSSRIDEI